MRKRYFLKLLGILSFLLVSGCASDLAMQDAQISYDQGRYEESILILKAALAKDETNAKLRVTYLSTLDRTVKILLDDADKARQEGRKSEAAALYKRILDLDRNNSRAQSGLRLVERASYHGELTAKAKQDLSKALPDQSGEMLRRILAEDALNLDAGKLQQELDRANDYRPESKISQALQRTLSIDFSNAMLKQVIEVFSRTTGVNFVLDKDVRTDQRVTVFLNKTSVREALDVVLFTNQLEQRELDTNTILIYPNTPNKLKDYQPLTVRGFFLTHADPEYVAAALKSLLKTKDVVVDKRQNMLTVRDTTHAVRTAERIVKLMDLPESEVMLEVEIMEVNRNRLLELGIKFPNQLTLTPLTTTLAELKNLTSEQVGAALSPAVINARRETGDINLLANPRIRARNRSTAKILIGDRVPNVTTTATATGFVATNVQYLDVGLKLEVVPTVTAGNEVVIQISLEVSNITDKIGTKDGSLMYQIGTRSASTVLTLKDGENQVLAGLISDEERQSGNKIPGLGDIPIIGRLFGSNLQDAKKTEIVLSITPRLVRTSERPDFSTIEFESGTESNPRRANSFGDPRIIKPLSLNSESIQTLPRQKRSAERVPQTEANNELPAPPVTPLVVGWEAPKTVRAGEPFSATLGLQNAQGIAGVPLSLSYDPTRIEVLDIQEGTLLSENGGATAFSQKVDRGTGMIYISATRSAKKKDAGASGTGSLATLKLKAIGGAGKSELKIVTLAPQSIKGNTVPIAAAEPLRLDIQAR